jgi:tetratricopeptide (TPR) repeat protein
MRYEEVMRDIIDSLTGDSIKDIAFLRQQMEFYKGHTLAPEILQGINHLIYHLLPEETKKEIELELQRNAIRNERKMKEAESLVREKEYRKAVNLLEKLIREEDGPGSLFRNDSVSEYYAFHNFFEEILFRELYKFRKIIRPVPGDFSGMYFLYGKSLLELGQVEDAKGAFEKSLRWNPMNLKPMFEQVEMSRKDEDEDGFLCLLKRCFRSAYTSSDLARCYRSLGQFHLEKGDHSLADTLYSFSMAFEGDNPVARAEIEELSRKMRKAAAAPPRLTEIWETCEESDVQIGPNRLVLDLAVSLGHKAMKEGAFVSARFLFGIAYDLTKDEKVSAWMDQLPQEEDVM